MTIIHTFWPSQNSVNDVEDGFLDFPVLLNCEISSLRMYNGFKMQDSFEYVLTISR